MLFEDGQTDESEEENENDEDDYGTGSKPSSIRRKDRTR